MAEMSRNENGRFVKAASEQQQQATSSVPISDNTPIDDIVQKIAKGEIKVHESSDAPKELRKVTLNDEQMKRALSFAKDLPDIWKDILPTKEYVKLPRRTDKVAIVGFANSWVKAPYSDPSFEIWGINELYKYLQSIPNGRADRWFEIHDIRNSPSKKRPEHQKWLKSANLPIYTWAHYDDMPGTMPYPKDEVLAKLKEIIPFGYNYFTNQISWMMALAWYEGFKEVHVYGVNMSTNSEYGFQRPSVESWLILLQAFGIKVYIPNECDLLKCPGGHLYGFESDNQARVLVKQGIADIKGRIAPMADQLEVSRYKHDKIAEEMTKTEGKILGLQDAMNAQTREQAQQMIQHYTRELNKQLVTLIRLRRTVEQSERGLAEYAGATNHGQHILDHVL